MSDSQIRYPGSMVRCKHGCYFISKDVEGVTRKDLDTPEAKRTGNTACSLCSQPDLRNVTLKQWEMEKSGKLQIEDI
jgi:hypothetical protein